MKFNEILKSLRNEKKMSQDQLADAMKMSRSSIGMYEQGRRFPKLEELEAFADYFNVDLNYLRGKQSIKRLYTVDTVTIRSQTVPPEFVFTKEDEKNNAIMKELSKLDERKKDLLLIYLEALNKDK